MMIKEALLYCFCASLLCLVEFLEAGIMPDASREGLVRQFNSYADVLLFDYNVPTEVSRATWNFAGFQDKADCPSRSIHVFLQHGSFPLFLLDNSSFPNNTYFKRTYLAEIVVDSGILPNDAVKLIMYNPFPGDWFAAAYLGSHDKKISQEGLRHKCRYSLGSVALWKKASNDVRVIVPNVNLTYRTYKDYSYYKFYVSRQVSQFSVTLTNCRIEVMLTTPASGETYCMLYVNIRAGALPMYEPDSEGRTNVRENENVTLSVFRPKVDTYYYILIESRAEISFNFFLDVTDCGNSGLYGRRQSNWFMSEEGLKFAHDSLAHQKEPLGMPFHIFSFENSESNRAYNSSFSGELTTDVVSDHESACFPVFDLYRIDHIDLFSASYILLGKTWDTTWISVPDKFPVITRLDTLPQDRGGVLIIKIKLDHWLLELADQNATVYACISFNQIPRISGNKLMCERSDSIVISSTERAPSTDYKMIPYPEPGSWHVSFQSHCSDNRNTTNCKDAGKVMIALDIYIQPCGYRELKDLCGPRGVCLQVKKSFYLFTTCRCYGGYRGWTCDDHSQAVPDSILLLQTLLLTISNVFFLPAIFLSVYHKLFVESLVYLVTMVFSTFYHVCDRQIHVSAVCNKLFVRNELLQYFDYFCAILSFWVTLLAIAKLPPKLNHFLHMFGVLLISILVQYNRTGLESFLIPILLALFVIFASALYKTKRDRQWTFMKKKDAMLLVPGVIFALIGLVLYAFVETTENYDYVHSVWHVLMAVSIVFLVPRQSSEELSYATTVPVSCVTITESLSSNASEELEIQENLDEIQVNLGNVQKEDNA